jgi:hypothetical protein
MSRKFLLIAGFTVSSAVLGWAQTATQSTTTTPASGPWGGPLLVTPITDFPNPVPTAGISNAGRAGISISTGGAGTSTSDNGIETTNAPISPATIVTAPVLPMSTNQMPVNDLGPSAFVGGPSDASAPSTVGVAEVATRFKAEKGTRNVRVLDNEDVQGILNNKNAVTMAKNMPSLGSETLDQGQTKNAGGQASATPAATQPIQQNSQANITAARAEQNSASGQATTGSSGQNQTATSDTEAENSTTPQINSNQQSNDAQGSRRLPATATFLPFLGLLGLLSGGIGFWFRKFRN